ncbi:hypothetical protein O7602_21325 [Micromonospora sp. WMMD1128]|uniref:hypothetical protein n=1 Tax=unclassified Micromonospora TaxID=2617518 RepID=UPI00248C1EBC|nr:MULTISPECIES: hypothetical protein [unclassified Micromonospora]WBB77128.1 hypothetical protein O7602_21325 [Micromonospora sp. WMMD1128]WFE36589.1 hypothetical protein O7613_02560 [Micromonospora sp. WMMD975]
MLRAGGLVALGGATAPLTGCDLFDRDDEPSPPDALEPLVAEALALEARHRAAATATPALAERLTPIADAHLAHAQELRRVIGRPAPSGPPSTAPSTAPSGTPSATPPGPPLATPPGPPGSEPDAVLAELRRAEQQGRTNAAKACAGAPPERAALLGSIAAARATHVEVLA